MLTIAEIMSGPVDELVCGTPDLTLEQLAALISRHHIGALPVLDDDGSLLGVVSESDLVRAVSMDGYRSLTLKATALMTRAVTTVLPTDNFRTAQKLMLKHSVRHLPVADDSGALVGMVSLQDLFRALSKE